MDPSGDGTHLRSELAPILALPTGRSTAGWPYLARAAWVRLRDWVPHLFGHGEVLLHACDALAHTHGALVTDAVAVVRQVVRTAAVTAPPDLWLLRHVFGKLAAAGWPERLHQGAEVPEALEPELTLLLSRGYLVRHGAGYRIADEPTAQRAWASLGPLGGPVDRAARWIATLEGHPPDDDAWLGEDGLVGDSPHAAPAWVATPEDIVLGHALVPLVLGMRATGRTERVLAAGGADASLGGAPIGRRHADRALAVLRAAAWIGADGALTTLGRRGLDKGPGPFGIIEAYHPYFAPSAGTAHVARAANVGASQDANRATFVRANDALDRFCADTGFTYTVFVEHAVGRGEAIRQRWARPGGHGLTYVGADLEPEALAVAAGEVTAGRLPPDVAFVEADIGRPDVLVAALRARGIDPMGAVMLVGNGFHEVRERSDARMVEVFRGYCEAGVVLVLTEECALSVDDLLRTAWNTYHAGFRYVHARSGQGLRPAGPAPVPGLGPPLPASWETCAVRAGYVPLERYASRSRTIYPYPPANGYNPSVSANLFLVPPRYAPT